MTILDTHAWVWWVAASRRLSAAARRAIDEAREIGVCAISVWELAMLVEKRRLELDRDLLVWTRQALALPRVSLLELTPERAVGAGRLGTDVHGDPADRMIVATALQLRAPVVTKDRRLRDVRTLRTIW